MHQRLAGVPTAWVADGRHAQQYERSGADKWTPYSNSPPTRESRAGVTSGAIGTINTLQVFHMYPASFQHITLTTAHVCESKPADASPSTVSYLARHLAGLPERGSFIALPQFGPCYRLWVRCAGPTLAGVVLLTESFGSVPVVGIAVCIDPEEGKRLWADLHADCAMPVPNSTARPPQSPWIGVRFEPGFLNASFFVAFQLGALERDLAWAFAQTCAGTARVAVTA